MAENEISIDSIIQEKVDKAIENHEIKLKEEDAKTIIKSILPELETLVSKVVIKHLKSLAIHMQKNLKD